MLVILRQFLGNFYTFCFCNRFLSMLSLAGNTNRLSIIHTQSVMLVMEGVPASWVVHVVN